MTVNRKVTLGVLLRAYRPSEFENARKQVDSINHAFRSRLLYEFCDGLGLPFKGNDNLIPDSESQAELARRFGMKDHQLTRLWHVTDAAKESWRITDIGRMAFPRSTEQFVVIAAAQDADYQGRSIALQALSAVIKTTGVIIQRPLNHMLLPPQVLALQLMAEDLGAIKHWLKASEITLKTDVADRIINEASEIGPCALGNARDLQTLAEDALDSSLIVEAMLENESWFV